MEQYISKDALLLEIDRQKIGYNVDGKHSVEYDITRKIIDIINSLEVKEADLTDRKTDSFSISKQIESVRDMYDKGVVDYEKFLETSTFYNSLRTLLKHKTNK